MVATAPGHRPTPASRALNAVPYNVAETDVRAIAASGGGVGVIFMPYWLGGTSRAGP